MSSQPQSFADRTRVVLLAKTALDIFVDKS